jgi:hypothetical protein
MDWTDNYDSNGVIYICGGVDMTHTDYKQKQAEILHTIFSMGKRGPVDGHRYQTIRTAAEQLDALILEAIGKNESPEIYKFDDNRVMARTRNKVRAEFRHIITGEDA